RCARRMDSGGLPGSPALEDVPVPVPRTARRLASLIAAILLVAQLLITTTPAALADPLTGIWTATGPGVVTVPHDGTTGGLAQVDYNYDLGNDGGATGMWTF